MWNRWCIAFGRALTLALVAGTVSLAPVANALAQEWSLGSKRFSTNAAVAAAPLRLTSAGRSGLQTFRFVGRVGGASFEAVAKPNQSMVGKSIELAYDPSRPDGSRLIVRTGSTTLRANIPDWQLRPITQFADSEYNAAVSLFGEGADSKKYYYIQYHDALKDTLLGMRMLQADILFIALHEHWRMPRYGGKLLLGTGEQDSREEQSMDAARKLDAALRGQKWRSWVLTDTGTQPTFGAVNGELMIVAKPYYYFWNANENEIEAGIQGHNRLIDEHNRIIASAKSSVEQYNSLVRTFNATTDPARRRALETQMEALKLDIDRQEKQLDALRARIESERPEPKVYEVTALTNAMRSLDGAIAEYNPSVYRAYQRVAQYSAFFRYVKTNNPASWKAFQQAMINTPIQPSVKTPTTWEREQR
jgi:hypothetical protein